MHGTLFIATFLTLVTGGISKWPVIINNSDIKDSYHCIYVFFICTDHVGEWPSNRATCMNTYRRCTTLLNQSQIRVNTTANPFNNEEPEDNKNEENEDQDNEEDEQIYASTCKELFGNGTSKSGVYKLRIGSKVRRVFCDMDMQPGGWTVIQRRGDFGRPNDYFFRNWTEYKEGFGDPEEDFWLGLEAIHELGVGKEQTLIITLEDFDNNRTALVVNNFTIGNEDSGFAISYKNYNSKIGNSLPARGTKFSTVDMDNDAWSKNCARRFEGAWWYSACHNSNLNGLYLKGDHESFGNGVNWYHWKGYHYSLKKTLMKVRNKDPRPQQPKDDST